MVLPSSPPDGLSPRSYCKLALQYHLMGNVRQTIKAGKLALAGPSEELAGTPLEDIKDEDRARLKALVDSLDQGVSISSRFLGGSRRLFTDLKYRLVDTSEKADQYLSDHQVLKIIKYGLEESIKSVGSRAGNALVSVAHSVILATHPSREVPTGLKKEEYMRLANRYIHLHWPEQARDALEKVIELDNRGLLAEAAAKMIVNRLPKYPVPYLAVKRYIDARRLASLGRGELALCQYECLVEDYPQFEWPLEQAAIYHIHQGNLDYAIELLERLLDFNPQYASAYQHLARAYAINGDILESQRALDCATELASNPDEIAVLRQMIAIISRL